MNVTEMDRLEKLENQIDGWPLLEFRKSIMRVKIQITMIAEAIINNTAFETISIIIILLNCVTLAMEDPTQKEQSQTDIVSEWTFQILYTIEMSLKILGMGLIFGKDAYLRDSWNILDFVIVMSAWVSIGQTYFFPEESSFESSESADEGLSISSLRAFRVLRPLRAITSIEGLKILVRAVLKAIPELQNTVIVLIFFFLIFATGGVNLFSGMLKQRCVNYETGRALDDPEFICGSSMMACPEGYFCGKQDVNPNYEVTNFDNIFWALLVIFQCITLEGWSDIQKMYQMAYTYYAFLFFVPMVFIGAFFLLNLTLAVINSKFSETMKENEESKKKMETESRQFKISKSQDDELQENIQKSEQQKLEERATEEIGIRQFYIAKKVAQKMISWYYYKKELLEIQQREELEGNPDINSVEELDISRNQASQDALMSDTHYLNSLQQQPNLVHQASSKQQPKVQNNLQELSRRSASMVESYDGELDHVSERQEEDDNHSEKVADFLQNLKDKDGGELSNPYRNTPLQRPPTGGANIFWDGNLSKLSSRNIFNAQNEMRRTNFAKFEKQMSKQPSYVFDNRSLQNSSRVVPMNKTLQNSASALPLTQTLVADIEPEASHRREKSGSRLLSRRFDNEQIVNQEYGFDKIVKEPVGPLMEDKRDPQDESRRDDDQADYDMSFIGNPLYDKVILSDRDRKKGMTLDDGSSSVISSEILSQLEPEIPAHQSNQESHLVPVKQNKRKQPNNRFRRMFTANTKKEDTLNETKLSTQYEGSQKAEELYSAHNFTDQHHNSFAQKDKKQSDQVSDIHSLKKRQSEIYSQVDADFLELDKKNFDPLKYIDKKCQKIVINPGVPYISTSHDAVFELRNKAAAKKIGKQTNPFIALPRELEDPEDIDSELDEQLFTIKPVFDAYQLKNVFVPIKKLELEIDEDDQDALILVLQPYETVMNIGYQDLLRHLPTKFFCRRSDIIVSSTLSITLTPKDDESSSRLNFAQIDETQADQWIDYWNKSRAREVQTSDFVRADYRYSARTRFSSETGSISKSFSSYRSSEASEIKRSQSMSPVSVSSPGQKLSMVRGSVLTKSGRRATVIPPSGLSTLLEEADINQMDKEEKRKYQMWREKFKVSQNQLEKMAIKPKERTYSLEEAKKLEDGLYHEDNENEEDPANAGAVTKQVYLARDNIEQDLKLEEFEQAVKAVINDDGGLDKLNEGNSIPDEIRQELNLPKDMKGFEIDYNQVRITDAQRSKKSKRKWSGQDVLENSLSNDASVWITGFLNKVRVFPKAGAGFIKKARCLLKQFVRTPLFENFMTISVLINTIVMAMDRYGIDQKEAQILDDLNQIFTWIFIVEMSCKLLATGPAKYVGDRMNILDGSVVILSIIEIVIAQTGDGDAGGGNLQAFRTVRVFRTFRVLRVTRLLRGLESMVLIINVIMKSFEAFFYITILMFTFVFIYALLGMQTFGGRYNFGDEDPPRGNYDSFEIAFVTVFQVLTMENWQLNLYQSMRTSNPKYVTAIFYVSWIFIGNFILLNLFLAILLDSFVNDEDVSEEQIELEKQAEQQQRDFNAKERKRRLQKLGKATNKALPEFRDNQNQETKKKSKKKKKATFTAKNRIAEEFQIVDNIEDLDTDQIKQLMRDESLVKTENKEWYKDKIDSSIKCLNAIYLLNKHSRFRIFCYNLQKHKYFDRIIMTLIALSSLKLATDTYMDGLSPESTAIVISDVADSIFTSRPTRWFKLLFNGFQLSFVNNFNMNASGRTTVTAERRMKPSLIANPLKRINCFGSKLEDQEGFFYFNHALNAQHTLSPLLFKSQQLNLGVNTSNNDSQLYAVPESREEQLSPMVMRVNITKKQEPRNRSPRISIGEVDKFTTGIEGNLLKLAEKYMHSQKRHKPKQVKTKPTEHKGGQVRIFENKFGYSHEESAQVRSEVESMQRMERLGSSQHFVFDQPQDKVPQTVNLTGASQTPAAVNRLEAKRDKQGQVTAQNSRQIVIQKKKDSEKPVISTAQGPSSESRNQKDMPQPPTLPLMTSQTEHVQEENLENVLDKSIGSGKGKTVWQQSWEYLQCQQQTATGQENVSQSHTSDVSPVIFKQRVTQHSALEQLFKQQGQTLSPLNKKISKIHVADGRSNSKAKVKQEARKSVNFQNHCQIYESNQKQLNETQQSFKISMQINERLSTARISQNTGQQQRITAELEQVIHNTANKKRQNTKQISKRHLDQNSQIDISCKQPAQSKTLRTDVSSRFDNNELYQNSHSNYAEKVINQPMDLKVIAQTKQQALNNERLRQPLDEYLNQVNPLLKDSKRDSKFNIGELYFQPRGKNVLQGMMTDFNSNEGMGVSIKQNFLQEHNDLYRSMQGSGFGRNEHAQGQDLRSLYRLQSCSKPKHPMNQTTMQRGHIPRQSPHFESIQSSRAKRYQTTIFSELKIQSTPRSPNRSHQNPWSKNKYQTLYNESKAKTHRSNRYSERHGKRLQPLPNEPHLQLNQQSIRRDSPFVASIGFVESQQQQYEQKDPSWLLDTRTVRQTATEQTLKTERQRQKEHQLNQDSSILVNQPSVKVDLSKKFKSPGKVDPKCGGSSPKEKQQWKVVPIQHRDSSIFLEPEQKAKSRLESRDSRQLNDTDLKSNRIDDTSSIDNADGAENNLSTHEPFKIVTTKRKSPVQAMNSSRLEQRKETLSYIKRHSNLSTLSHISNKDTLRITKRMVNRSLHREETRAIQPRRTTRTLERDNRRAAGGKKQNQIGILIKGGFPRLSYNAHDTQPYQTINGQSFIQDKSKSPSVQKFEDLIALRQFDQALKILNKNMEEEKVEGFTITSLSYSKNDLLDMSKIISANFTPNCAEPATTNLSPRALSPRQVHQQLPQTNSLEINVQEQTKLSKNNESEQNLALHQTIKMPTYRSLNRSQDSSKQSITQKYRKSTASVEKIADPQITISKKETVNLRTDNLPSQIKSQNQAPNSDLINLNIMPKNEKSFLQSTDSL